MSDESKFWNKSKNIKLQTGYDSQRYCSISTLRLFLLPASRMQRVYSPPCSLLRGNALSNETLSSLVCFFLCYFIVSFNLDSICVSARLSCVNVKDLQHCLVCACASEGKFRSSSVEAEDIFEVFSLAVKSQLYIFVSFFGSLDVYSWVKSAKTCLCLDMSAVFVLLSQIMLRFMRALSVRSTCQQSTCTNPN